MVERTITRTIEGSTEREIIFALLKDPARIPEWAPAFADEVLPSENNSWKVLKLGETFSLTVVIEPRSWTVDYLRTVAPGLQGGAFIRLLPRPGGGTVVTMTLPIPSASDANQVGKFWRWNCPHCSPWLKEKSGNPLA